MFEQTIYQNWANYFGCPAAAMFQTGATLVPVDRFSGDNVLALWHIGRHTFVEFDPALARQVESAVRALPANTGLTGNDLRSAWGDAAIKSQDVGLVHYLYPPDLPDFSPPAPFRLRQLTAADGAFLTALHQANTPEEVDDGFVEVSHLIAFGCLADNRLVAAASGYLRAGFMDIGVLTHPEFRRQGLGKGVVGAVCAWSTSQGIIAQYRCNAHNAGSHGVAKALNFRRYFTSESIWLR